MERRELINWTVGLSVAACGLPVVAQPGPAMRLGVDSLIQDSGLAGRWNALMARDLGLKVDWVRATSGQVLTDLESGALPIGLFFRQDLADRLEQDGLIHDRHTLAHTQTLLVGPANDPARIRPLGTAALALRQILMAQAAGACRWEAPLSASALRPVSDALVARAGMSAGPAGQGVPPSSSPPYRLLSQSEWAALPKALRQGLMVFNEKDPLLQLHCQVARSFRARHPASKLLADWLRGPVGRRGVQQARAIWRQA